MPIPHYSAVSRRCGEHNRRSTPRSVGHDSPRGRAHHWHTCHVAL